MMLMSLKSYFSFWSETTGAADVVAVKPCVGVPLTHCLQIHLRHLQNQTQLLAEQQLQGYAESKQDEHMHQVGVKKKYNMLHFGNTPTSDTSGGEVHVQPAVPSERHLQQAGDEAAVADVMPRAQKTICHKMC